MAFNAGPIKMRVTYQDNTAKTYTKSYEVNTAHVDQTSLEVLAGAAGKVNSDFVMGILGAVTQAKIISYNISQDFVNDAAGNGAGDWDDKAVVSVLVADPDDPTKRSNIYINAPVDGIFVGDAAFGPESETVDPTDADLIDFLALFQETEVDGATPAGVFLFSDGEQMNDTPAAKGTKH